MTTRALLSFTTKNEDIYIDNGVFTSCDDPHPHYYFASKKMKVDNQSSQIIAKPMIMYMHDLPAFAIPFAESPISLAAAVANSKF